MVIVRLTLGMGLLALVLVGSGFLVGGDKKPDGKEAKLKETLPPLWQKVGLTDDQIQQVCKMDATYRTKINVLKQQIEDLRAEEAAEKEKVLTDAQKTRLKELK